MNTEHLREFIYNEYVFSGIMPSTLGGVIDHHLRRRGTTGIRWQEDELTLVQQMYATGTRCEAIANYLIELRQKQISGASV